MPLICETFTAPESWASYLVNGDSSGLEAQEVAQADAWAATLPGQVSGIAEGDSWFTWSHDAQTVTGRLGATVAAYQLLRDVPEAEAETHRAQEALEAAGDALAQAEERADQARADLEEAQEADQAALEKADQAAQAALEEADAAESAAHARLRAALAEEARQNVLARVRPVMAAPHGWPEGRNLADLVAPGGWHVLAEYLGRRYHLGAYHFADHAEAAARAWSDLAQGRGLRLAVFLADRRDSLVQGQGAELLAALAPGYPNRGPWCGVAFAWSRGDLVPVARLELPQGVDAARVAQEARAWAAMARGWWPEALAALDLVNLETGQAVTLFDGPLPESVATLADLEGAQ